MNLNDQYLLGRIKRGDIGAFEQMFHRFYPGMCHYAIKLVKQDTTAEEIVQDVFYNIWKNREVIRISSSLRNYLFRSVFNNSMMFLRKSGREILFEDNRLEPEGYAESPAETIEEKEINEIINNTLDKLPERTREIFILNRFEGLKYKDVASRLSISVKTVEANMGKALKAFRRSLDNYD